MIDRRALIAAFLAALAFFVMVDGLWLSLVAMELFKRQLGDVLRPQPWLAPVVAFYIVYAFGIVALAVRPALAAADWRIAATHGAILGLTAYATFDLTNLAVIGRWTYGLAVLDIAWGTGASGSAAVAGFVAGRMASRKTRQSFERH